MENICIYIIEDKIASCALSGKVIKGIRYLQYIVISAREGSVPSLIVYPAIIAPEYNRD